MKPFVTLYCFLLGKVEECLLALAYFAQDTRDPPRPTWDDDKAAAASAVVVIQVENLRMTLVAKPVTLKMTKKTKHLADLVMEDENNNQVNNQGISEEGDQITLYVRAGCDNRKYGACPFCQRIFMFLMLKSEQGGKRQIPDPRQSNYPFYCAIWWQQGFSFLMLS